MWGVDTLRRALYLQAAVWAVAGTALAVAPRFVLATLFDQGGLGDAIWARLLGVQSVGISMLAVLVAHRVDELWWWSWAFALAAVATAVVAVLHLAFGRRPDEAALLWWVFSGLSVGLALFILAGLYITSRQHPIPWEA